MIVLLSTFHLHRCKYQEGREQCGYKAQHNPRLLNSWIIIAVSPVSALTAADQCAHYPTAIAFSWLRSVCRPLVSYIEVNTFSGWVLANALLITWAIGRLHVQLASVRGPYSHVYGMPVLRTSGLGHHFLQAELAVPNRFRNTHVSFGRSNLQKDGMARQANSQARLMRGALI
jgi:hypothetical protein